MLFFLFFTSLSYGSTLLWSYSYTSEQPRAAYYEVASDSILVSVQNGERARLDRFSLSGNLIKRGEAEEIGAAGPLRSYDGKIFWWVGEKIFKIEDSKSKIYFEIGSSAGDLTLGANGDLIAGDQNGNFWRNKTKLFSGKPVKSIFYFDQAYFTREGKIWTEKEKILEPICDCIGLERSFTFGWITANGANLLSYKKGKRKKLLRAESNIGKFSYVYRKESLEDFVVLPLPELKKISAFRIR